MKLESLAAGRWNYSWKMELEGGVWNSGIGRVQVEEWNEKDWVGMIELGRMEMENGVGSWNWKVELGSEPEELESKHGVGRMQVAERSWENGGGMMQLKEWSGKGTWSWDNARGRIVLEGGRG